MAYQNVGTPRFYVDWGSWLKSIGKFEIYQPYNRSFNTWIADGFITYDEIYNAVGLNPSKTITATVNGYSNWGEMAFTSGTFGSDDPNLVPNYFALLGHNFNTASARFQVEMEAGFDYNPFDAEGNFQDTGQSNHGITQTPIVNAVEDASSPTNYPQYDGFSIIELSDPTGHDNYIRPAFASVIYPEPYDEVYTADVKMGAMCYGRFYNMPHSPDLNLKMSIEMDGVKTIQSRGGATLSNATYTKPADWGEFGAWQLGSDEDDNPISNLRSGRRVWDLSFSYLSDSSVMPANASTTNLSGSEADDFETDILDGTDFFSQVWNKTMGGHLPFIFQPDAPTYNATTGLYEGGNNNPDQFAICRFDMNSLQYDLVANNVYNVKLKIRESW
jgi:hypothetical protein